MELTNIFKHTKTIFKHKWVVFKLCCKAGIPWRGLVHDLSKFSPTEFGESIKYYTGKRSPNALAKEAKGYSAAWLHHFGKNKHHHEYWYDYDAPLVAPIIPYKYLVESICDNLAAGITYKGKEWTKEYQLSYWERKQKVFKGRIHPKINEFYITIFTEVSKFGIKNIINKKNLKEKYAKIILGGKDEK